MDPHAELELLLTSVFDGAPDEANNRRLDELLRAHPELQEEYLDFMQLHALLQWRAGQAIAQGEQPATSPRPALHRPARWRRRAGIAAAVMLLAASFGALLVWQIPNARATPDLVERLIDWNLDLTQARSSVERDRIYASRAADIKATFAKAELAAEDRALAETLLQTGSWLVKNADPTAEAERFNDIADMVVARLDGAAAAQDERRVVNLADVYQRLTEVGVDRNVERAHASGGLDADKKQKLERTTLHHAHRGRKLAAMIERQPEPSRKAMRRAMKGHFHKTKKNQKSTE